MVEETMSTRATDKRTGDYANEIDGILTERFREAGLGSHGISIERTSESSLSLVRTAISNECRKHVTLVLPTPGEQPPPATVDMKELIRRRNFMNSETREPRDPGEWKIMLDAYVHRAIRAAKRDRAILDHPGACERFPWTHTIHAVVKSWLDHVGLDLETEGEAAYTKTLHAHPGSIGEWYFIDGYAVCAGVQNEARDAKVFSNQTDRTVRMEVQSHLPETAVLGLTGKRLGDAVEGPFVRGNEDIRIREARRISTPSGAMVLSITLEPREVPMAPAPDGFDTSWMNL